jgi:DNA-directed RNA polymerase specialized sigma24 family protein
MQRCETWDAPERTNPDELNAARVRLLIADALGQLSAEDRALIGRSYYLGWTTAQIADDLHIAEWFVKSRLHVALQAVQRALVLAGRDLGVQDRRRNTSVGDPAFNPVHRLS